MEQTKVFEKLEHPIRNIKENITSGGTSLKK